MSGVTAPSGCSGFDYAPFYCEENIYRLARQLADTLESDATAVFITNADRTIALLSQRAGRRSDGLVIWDYHVVLRSGALVYDLDTRLACPSLAPDWLAGTAPLVLYDHYPELAPQFIEVPADAFLTQFSTDRRHMRTTTGAFIHQPPDWQAPFDSRLGHTLPAFLNAAHAVVGRVIPVSQAHREW